MHLLLNSMSQLSTNPNTTYVIETDPNFYKSPQLLIFWLRIISP